MSSAKFAIVCDGKEISYGLNLLHLFQYKDENIQFYSELFDNPLTDIYSIAAFMHSNISADTVKIFINDAQKTDSSYKEIFCKYGMFIFQCNSQIIVKADSNGLAGENYELFLKYANQKRKEYLSKEKDYSARVESINKNWISKEFKQESSGGLFSKNKNRIKQQYDCLSYVLYVDVLKNM